MTQRRHDPVFPGFKEMAARRERMTEELVARRLELGLSQTEVAARMGTSQSAVARLESGEADEPSREPSFRYTVRRASPPTPRSPPRCREPGSRSGG